MVYELNNLYCEDCLAAMRVMPDGYFDLAVVDPPYGGGAADAGKGKPRPRFSSGLFNKYVSHGSTPPPEIGVHFHGRGRSAKYARPEIQCSRTGGTWAAKYQQGKRNINDWDIAPPPKYFKELFRVSRNQIIWGGNYFGLSSTRCFLVWRKLTISGSFTMAMCEYAWTSFNGNAKWIELAPQGTAKEQRFHPTQKPVALYAWVLNNFAKKGDRILDTHAGSASSLIACIDAGYEYMGFEIDGYYFRMAQSRIADRLAQTSLFDNGGQDSDRREQDRQLDLDYGCY